MFNRTDGSFIFSELNLCTFPGKYISKSTHGWSLHNRPHLRMSPHSQTMSPLSFADERWHRRGKWRQYCWLFAGPLFTKDMTLSPQSADRVEAWVPSLPCLHALHARAHTLTLPWLICGSINAPCWLRYQQLIDFLYWFCHNGILWIVYFGILESARGQFVVCCSYVKVPLV